MYLLLVEQTISGGEAETMCVELRVLVVVMKLEKSSAKCSL